MVAPVIRVALLGKMVSANVSGTLKNGGEEMMVLVGTVIESRWINFGE